MPICLSVRSFVRPRGSRNGGGVTTEQSILFLSVIYTSPLRPFTSLLAWTVGHKGLNLGLLLFFFWLPYKKVRRVSLFYAAFVYRRPSTGDISLVPLLLDSIPLQRQRFNNNKRIAQATWIVINRSPSTTQGYYYIYMLTHNNRLKY